MSSTLCLGKTGRNWPSRIGCPTAVQSGNLDRVNDVTAMYGLIVEGRQSRCKQLRVRTGNRLTSLVEDPNPNAGIKDQHIISIFGHKAAILSVRTLNLNWPPVD